MLPEYCVDCIEPIPCCRSIYDAARAILDIAWAKLVECAGSDCCDLMEHFVAAAEPHLAVADYLAVYIPDVSVAPVAVTGTEKMLSMKPQRVTCAVKLVESGYPVIEEVGTEIHEPTGAELAWISRHALSHIEAIYRGVLSALMQPNPCGDLISVGGLRSAVGGGSIVWQFTVTLNITWN